MFWLDLLWFSSAQEYLPSGVLFVSRSVVDSAKTSSFCRIMRNITLMPHKDHVIIYNLGKGPSTVVHVTIRMGTLSI